MRGRRHRAYSKEWTGTILSKAPYGGKAGIQCAIWANRFFPRNILDQARCNCELTSVTMEIGEYLYRR